MSEWIEWSGGECPVEESARIEVQTRNGCEFKNTRAGSWAWNSSGQKGDIIAYRIVKEKET